MQKSPLTPSATSWSSRAGPWLCAGESVAGADSDTGTHPALRALGQADLTIYIVEDSEAVKERLIESVEDIPHARVVGSADGVAAALEGMRTVQPRVLILDIHLRGGSGFRLRWPTGLCFTASSFDRSFRRCSLRRAPRSSRRAGTTCPIAA